MTSFGPLRETPFKLTYINPVRNIVTDSGMPKAISDIIAGYADEHPVVEKVTLTNWETARKIVLCIVTLGLWRVYQTHQYEKIMLHSLDGSGIKDAIKALKRGADPSHFAVRYNSRPLPSDFTLEPLMLMHLREARHYVEYEFAFAQLNDSAKRYTFFQPLVTLIEDLEIWKIISKYKGVEDSDRGYLMNKFVREYDTFSDASKEIIDSKKLFQIMDTWFGECWYRLNYFHAQSIVDEFDRQHDIESIKKVLEKCPALTRFCLNKMQGAIQERNEELVKLLALHHRNPFKDAIEQKNLEAIQWILAIGLSPDREDISLALESTPEIFALMNRGPFALIDESESKESHSTTAPSVQSLNIDDSNSIMNIPEGL